MHVINNVDQHQRAEQEANHRLNNGFGSGEWTNGDGICRR